MFNLDNILYYFPIPIQNKIKDYILNLNLFNIEEIRIRVNKPILIKIGQADALLEYVVSQNEVLEILQKICDNSIYSYQSQICNGYITLNGGHRVGITGNAVVENGKVINISYIYSLNFRIARQIIGCGTKALKYVIDTKLNTVFNSLIISPPGRGKTTLLRDIVRQISNGVPEMHFNGINVGIVDERDEIAAMYKGVPQNDVGIRTDILSNIPKAIGMKMLIRTMSPNVVVADEIGTKEDVDAIYYAVRSGVKGIFTAHGSNLEDIMLNPILKILYEMNVFERILLVDEHRDIQLLYEKINIKDKITA